MKLATAAIGTERTKTMSAPMSAFRGKAEILCSLRALPVLTH